MNSSIAPLAVLAAIIIVAGALFLLRRVAPGSAMNRLTNPEGFAAMVVAEIKMYHGRAVETAFQESAIYRTFKDDIDRSRKMFLQKFPDAEAAFYAALVRILANGQPDRLGSDYPYARTNCCVSGRSS